MFIPPKFLDNPHKHKAVFSLFNIIVALTSAVISSWTAVSLQVSWDSEQTWETFITVKWADYLYEPQKVYHRVKKVYIIYELWHDKIIDIWSIQKIQLHHIPHKLYDVNTLQASLTAFWLSQISG